MRHTPDADDVRRMIDRAVHNAVGVLLGALNACAQGNADGNVNFRDIKWIADGIESGKLRLLP